MKKWNNWAGSKALLTAPEVLYPGLHDSLGRGIRLQIGRLLYAACPTHALRLWQALHPHTTIAAIKQKKAFAD